MKHRPRSDILADPFSAHEALDRAHLAAVFFDENVAEHAHVKARPGPRGVAGDLAERLASFYQLVGTAVFGAQPKASRGRRGSKRRSPNLQSS